MEKSIVCFGEILWDVLPAGEEPGGAPINVAYHLTRHRQHATVITRIGNDDAGRRIKTVFSERGVDTSYFTTDDVFQTGIVYATPDENNDMSYEIVQPVAWDHIPLADDIISLVARAGYFVYGSLAARSEQSRATLLHLLTHASVKVFDINLRQPHYTKETLLLLLEQANILKLNEAELELVGSWFTSLPGMRDRVLAIQEKFKTDTVVVTLGSRGALLFTAGIFYEHPGYDVKVVDTIGSGDAFLAGILTQFQQDALPVHALDYACKLGAFVAGKKGGCPLYEAGEVSDMFFSR